MITKITTAENSYNVRIRIFVFWTCIGKYFRPRRATEILFYLCFKNCWNTRIKANEQYIKDVRSLIKNNRYFSNFEGCVWLIFALFLLLCWYTYLLYVYVDNISHFGLSVCFWQIKRLIVFWCALRFFTIRKHSKKKLY